MAIADQAYATLFANADGVSISDGEARFSTIGDGSVVRTTRDQSPPLRRSDFTPRPAFEAEVISGNRCMDWNEHVCWAGSLTKPQLIHQISSSSCILNKSWGYNPKSGYIWVAEGGAGVFVNVAGYHHGRGDGHDADARAYDDHGHDVGAAVGGAVVGALIAGMSDTHTTQEHTTTSYVCIDGSNGCHGVGCRVDTPGTGDDPIDPAPQYDAEGEPNAPWARRRTIRGRRCLDFEDTCDDGQC